MTIPFNAEEYRQQMSGQMSGQNAQAHLQQGQMPVTQPPPVPAQYVPPMVQVMPKTEEIAPPKKMSRFKLKRGRKEKPAKPPKGKAVKGPNLDADGEVIQKARTSPAMIFMFGMATGISRRVGHAANSVLMIFPGFD